MKTRLFFSIVALLVLTSCAKKSVVDVQTTETERFHRDKAEYEPNVGKDYWIKTIVFLCAAPANVGTHCDPILTDVKLHTDSLEQGAYGMPYHHVTLGDGRSGYVIAADLKIAATDVDPAVAAVQCKRRGEPRVGMSAKQVVATCWGKPDHVDRRETARGVTERYVYDNGRVLLHNGIVTSVQFRGTLR